MILHSYITVVGGGHNILKFLSIENVNGHEVAFCMPVLPGLRSGYLNNLQHKINEIKQVNSKKWKQSAHNNTYGTWAKSKYCDTQSCKFHDNDTL
jgi:hypothetical protein